MSINVYFILWIKLFQVISKIKIQFVAKREHINKFKVKRKFDKPDEKYTIFVRLQLSQRVKNAKTTHVSNFG